MRVGFIGLGKMGHNMVLNLIDHKHKVVAYDISSKAVKKVSQRGAIAANSLEEIVKRLPKKRVIWLMIPAGKPVDDTLKKLTPLLNKGDIIIDGGNSFFEDSMRRFSLLKKKGINFLDCGTSGGISGARQGACMMIGGERRVFKKAEKLFKDMCVKEGYAYMGKAGAGHFVKAVHNAIEYGMMGAIAEGFLAIEKEIPKFGTKLNEVSKVYAHGSIIEGKLIKWLWDAYNNPAYLAKVSCEVPKGETEEEMKLLEKLTNMPILHQARLMREKSRKKKVCGKIVAVLRNQFGGHEVIKK